MNSNFQSWSFVEKKKKKSGWFSLLFAGAAAFCETRQQNKKIYWSGNPPPHADAHKQARSDARIIRAHVSEYNGGRRCHSD